MTAPDSVVTGEAVALDLRAARLPTRALGMLLDVVLQVAALVGLVLLAGRLLQDSDPALRAAVQLTLTVSVLVGYPVASETLFTGRTLGKAALGLRVVRDDGGPIRFRQALVRGLLGFFVDIWLTSGIGAIIASTVSTRGKRLGDVLAGTLVIRDRAPAGGGPAPAMPTQLTAWAAAADLSRVDDRQALAARQVLNRSRQLAPAAYGDLCHRIAGAVAAVVSPPPPLGTSPDLYLAAVLAERRRRAELRLRPAAAGQPAEQPREVPPDPGQPAPVQPDPRSAFPATRPPGTAEPSEPRDDSPGGGGFALPG